MVGICTPQLQSFKYRVLCRAWTACRTSHTTTVWWWRTDGGRFIPRVLHQRFVSSWSRHWRHFFLTPTALRVRPTYGIPSNSFRSWAPSSSSFSLLSSSLAPFTGKSTILHDIVHHGKFGKTQWDSSMGDETRFTREYPAFSINIKLSFLKCNITRPSIQGYSIERWKTTRKQTAIYLS